MEKRTLIPGNMYLRVLLHWADPKSAGTNLRVYKTVALASVRSLFGEAGILSEIDVIELLPDKSAVLRVDARFRPCSHCNGYFCLRQFGACF